MRLIDADALMKEYADFVAPSNNSDFADVPTWNDAVSLLGSAPTIERKKGKWIHERLASTTGGSYPIVRCSVCQGTIPMEWETHYCPHCGADMRGDVNG